MALMGLVSSNLMTYGKDSVSLAATNATATLNVTQPVTGTPQLKNCHGVSDSSDPNEEECSGIYADGSITYNHIYIFFTIVILIVALDLTFNTDSKIPYN